eukprot:Opistho-1_new@34140
MQALFEKIPDIIINYDDGWLHSLILGTRYWILGAGCRIGVVRIDSLAVFSYFCSMMLKHTLLKATEAGAAEITRFFNGEFKVSNKEGINNLVTEADHAAEKAIFEVIQKEFPDHYILSEESGEIVMDSSYKWIIDPIDGTVNFANGIPICCVSIGVEHNGQMIMGAVYNPFLKELFFAQHGFGATMNDKRIHVSEKNRSHQQLSGYRFPVYLSGHSQRTDRNFLQTDSQRRACSQTRQCCY